MSFRHLEKVILLAGLAAGAILTPGSITGDVRTSLITFFGLFSASILPTVSLMINSMTANGRSIQGVNLLNHELKAAMDALFFIFGCVLVSVVSLIFLSFSSPLILSKIPFLITEIAPRAGQGFLVAATCMLLLRAGQIPGILRHLLSVRHEIALAEARQKLEENAPEPGAMRQLFVKHPDFGKTVSLQDLAQRDS